MRYPTVIHYAPYQTTVSALGEKVEGYGNMIPVHASVYALTDTDTLKQYGITASRTKRIYIRGMHPLKVRDRVRFGTHDDDEVWRVVEAVQYRQHKTAVITDDNP